MTQANKLFLNFAGGEVSPDMQIRTDLPAVNKVLARMDNFIAHPVGKAEFRSGTRYVHHTKNHNAARFIEFQFSDEQAYLIEATNGYFRFYKDEAVILGNTAKVITGVTRANPGVVSYTGADPTNGQEVYITGIVGMTELNGRYFTVSNVNAGANTFELEDEFGNNINTTAYTAWSSGGTWTEIYEIATPYATADLDELMFDQTADTMYIVHQNYEPRKLVRAGHAAWTLSTYTRTNDPFPASPVINNITFPGGEVLVQTATAHGFTTGQTIDFTGIVGTVELNAGGIYKVGVVASATTFYVAALATGVHISSAGLTAYTSDGVVSLTTIYPAAVAFTEDARTVMGGSGAYPEKLRYSRSPNPTTAALRFDDYTTGTDDDHAMSFTLAPLKGKVDAIRWIANTDKFQVVGTFGSVRRVFGASEAEPATPTGITAKMVNADGVHRAKPVVDGSTAFYITRNGLSVESVEYDYQIDGYAPDNKNLISEHLTEGTGVKQLARQVGQPTLIWAVRNDGVLLGLTYKAKENIAGWHQHHLAGDGVVEWVGTMPRENSQDQLWLIVRRTVNGQTVRHVEFMTDRPVYPLRDDFTGIGADKAADDEAYCAYQWEALKQAVHLDASLSYDGSDYGTDAGATLTPAAGAATIDSTDIVFTAGAAVFTAAMVGRELWGKYDNAGGGGGRATITGYTDSTHVTCTITAPWPIEAFAAGDWYLTTDTVSGLRHLEGETVSIVADGVEQDADDVSAGALTLDVQASVIHVGLPYEGTLKTLPVDAGGTSGGAISKLKTVSAMGLWLRNTAQISIGTDLYRMSDVAFRGLPLVAGRAVPLFNGIHIQRYPGSWQRDTALYIRQTAPLPATIQGIDAFLQVTDE